MENTEESGDYFVSMTDMMVGVLFVFIIIVSYFVLELQKSLDKVAKKEEVVLLSTHERIVDDLIKLKIKKKIQHSKEISKLIK